MTRTPMGLCSGGMLHKGPFYIVDNPKLPSISDDKYTFNVLKFLLNCYIFTCNVH
jgi:hypothetical protein